MKGSLLLSLAATALAGGSLAVGTALAGPAMDKVESRGTLSVCADPYIFPASEANAQPPGYDIEIISAVAEKNGWSTSIVWTDTGTRGGLGRALRTSIAEGACEVFVGIGVSPNSEDELEEKNLQFTRPYLGVGYVLVVQGPASDASSLKEVVERKIEVGVPMSTPIDAYLFDNNYERELYNGNKRLVEGLVQDEINAAMLWSTYIPEARRTHPEHEFTVAPGFEPTEDLKWDYAMVVPGGEPELMDKINGALTDLLADGTITDIVESYGVPFFTPSNMPEIQQASAQQADSTAEAKVEAAEEAIEDPNQDMGNPLAGDPEAIAHGKERYSARCAFCHGGGGHGAKGPNLIDDKWKFGGRNEDIFYNIAAGIPNTQMGAFGATLSGDDIWSIIAYLRDENRKLNAAKEDGGN